MNIRRKTEINIYILWENIKADMKIYFRIEDFGMNIGSYDYDSIMHYPDYAFSKNNNITIKTKNPKYQNVIGMLQYLSRGDINTVNYMYKKNRFSLFFKRK